MAYPAISIIWLFLVMLLMPKASHSIINGSNIGYAIIHRICQCSQSCALSSCTEVGGMYKYWKLDSLNFAPMRISYGVGNLLGSNEVYNHPQWNSSGFHLMRQRNDAMQGRVYAGRHPMAVTAMPTVKKHAARLRLQIHFGAQRMRDPDNLQYHQIIHGGLSCDKNLLDGSVRTKLSGQSERFTDDLNKSQEVEKLRQLVFIISAIAALLVVVCGILFFLLRRLKKEFQRGKKLELEIRNVAFYDPLTKLPNRRLLFERLQQAITQSTRRKTYGAILFLDLDKFKVLNDTRGHDVGDLLLIEVAQRLQACVREEDTVARLGGDEFVVMLENLGNNANYAAARARKVGLKVLDALSQPYLLKGREFRSSSSIGISLFINRQETPSDLLKRSDTAMYQAKNGGRNTLRFFDPAMQKVLDGRLRFEKEIRLAIVNREYRLCYQLQVDSRRQPIGAEALLRWEHPQRGLLLPKQFMPLAEESGLSEAIGLWVLETACMQLQVWQSQPQTRDLTLAINICSRQFHHPEFVSHVQAIIDASGIDPTKLKIELTEKLVQKDMRLAIDKMHPLKSMGVKFSLDDFGIGHSSLRILKKLPLDQLKIDLSLVRDLTSDARTAAIVRAIIDISKTLGYEVVAEGVETEEQFDYLSRNGCLAFQGYLFGNLKSSAELLPDRECSGWSTVQAS